MTKTSTASTAKGTAPIPLSPPASLGALAVGGATAGKRPRATPVLLRFALFAIPAACLLAWAVGFGLLRDVHAGAYDILVNSKPSVVAAQDLRTQFASMDADAANALLVHGTKGASESWADFDKHRSAASAKIVDAAKNITYDEEKRPILALSDGFAAYSDAIGRVRSKIEGVGAGEPVPDSVLSEARKATALLHDTLLKQAGLLNKVNEDHLRSAYAERLRVDGVEIAIFLAAALPAAALLFWTQRLLTRRTRRAVNPGLAAASAALFIGMAACVYCAASANKHLKIATSDAFDSIAALSKARAEAFDANADESWWLLARTEAERTAYDTAFWKKAQDLAGPKAGDDTWRKAAYKEVETFKAKGCPAGTAPKTGGYIGEGLGNITFEGECQGLALAFDGMAKYLAIDAQIRAFERSGHHAEAIALDIGTGENQSNWAFDRMDAGLKKTIEVNEKAYEEAAKATFSRLDPATWILSVTMLLAAALSALGLRPRIDEYRP